MDWTKFNTHGESNNHAFEVMCNLIFENWCKAEFGDKLKQFTFINGAGGDGGLEAYGVLDDGKVIGVQSKWFPDKLEDSQIRQIEKSFATAVKVRPEIYKYIVCIPRDLSSKKVGRNNAIIKINEEVRWNKLVEKCKIDVPCTSIELWTETRIQEKLTRPEMQGIYEFWFNNTKIFDLQFEMSLNKAYYSWAKLKYIPDLYAMGYIHNNLESFLGSYRLTECRYRELMKILNILAQLKRSYKDLLKIDLPDKEQALREKIFQDILIIEDWVRRLEPYKGTVINGGIIPFGDKKFKLKCSVADIKKSTLYFEKYFHFHDIEKILERIEDEFENFKKLLGSNFLNKIIFLGDPGTGKTAGIVSEVTAFLRNKTHLPVLVHAKEFAEGDTWASILEKTLGLSSGWNERELFIALESAAYIRNISNSGKYAICSNCVVCVDGIDESESWAFWKNKIEEVSAFEEDFPRIKFVFLSRPYVFENYHKLDYRQCFYLLPLYGDVSPQELCDLYFKKYQIDIGKNTWIKKLLKTPLSVKMFCDIYRNRNVKKLEKNTTVITKLFEKKIDSLEDIYSLKTSNTTLFGIVKAILYKIALFFRDKTEVTYSEIYNTVGELEKSNLQDIVKILVEEGFLYTFNRQKDVFSPPQIFYSWGMQPALDYLMAQILFKNINAGEKIEIEYTDGIYQMLSLVTIEEGGKLLFEYSNINMESDIALDLACYSLSNASANAVVGYRDFTKEIMKHSVSNFREIVNRVILPVCSIDNHPLGSLLLDEFLRDFETPAEKDIWWSIPTYLNDNYNSWWQSFTEMKINEIKLTKDDGYLEAPLILVWGLSSVNNQSRKMLRLKLLKWGIMKPMEYWKLFLRFMDINDEQVIEDLYAIAYGLALAKSVEKDYLIESTKWIMENVFSYDGLRKFENTVIRYYSRGIVKIAISKRLCGEDLEKTITPPYNYEPACMSICTKAINAERMGGYSAIQYDLSRYVLCNSFDCFFRKNYITNDYSEEVKRFLGKYKLNSNMNADGLIISMAYQYLLDQGWDEKTFWSYDDKDNLGVDVVIRRTYFPASHGTMSKIMCVAEKNTWIAKHKIEAIVANEVPTNNNDGTIQYIKDYSQIENFINTYQDYANDIYRGNQKKWFHIDSLATMDYEEMEIEKIEEWMREDYIPDFNMWIKENDGMTLLDTFTNVYNSILGIEEIIWVSSGIVKKQEFDKFLDTLCLYSESRTELLNVNDFRAYQDCEFYCTPQEACTVHSNREIKTDITFEINGTKIKVYKLVTECLSADEFENEKSFTLPSAIIRTMTGIIYGDGYQYKDLDGNDIAIFIDNGEKWGTQQKSLLIDSNVLEVGLDAFDYKMFWLYRVYRSPSNKAYERFPHILHDTDKTFAVWFEGEQLKYQLLEVMEPFSNIRNPIEEDSLVDELLKPYLLFEGKEC